MIQGAHIPQQDLILYAMQTLQGEELAQVRAHLDGCEECRAELAQTQGDLALVSLSVDQQELPQGARERFLHRIEDGQRSAGATVVPIEAKRPAGRAAFVIPWLAAAALLLVAISQGMRIGRLNRELAKVQEAEARQASENANAREVMELLTSRSAKRVVLTANVPKPAPTGRAVYLAESGALIFQANSLDRLAENKTYELWVIPANGQAPIPAGLFRPDAEGNASVVMPPLPKGVPAKAFGVTVEKAEGSTTPTAPIVLSGAVPSSGE
jgi:Anti-sigma-K factor rskA/Putative zinc-finger